MPLPVPGEVEPGLVLPGAPGVGVDTGAGVVDVTVARVELESELLPGATAPLPLTEVEVAVDDEDTPVAVLDVGEVIVPDEMTELLLLLLLALALALALALELELVLEAPGAALPEPEALDDAVLDAEAEEPLPTADDALVVDEAAVEEDAVDDALMLDAEAEPEDAPLETAAVTGVTARTTGVAIGIRLANAAAFCGETRMFGFAWRLTRIDESAICGTTNQP